MKANQKIKIMVVDDDIALLNLMNEALRNYDYEPFTETNPLIALSLISQINFDVIITDLRMPEIDGFQMLDKINEIDPDLPVIMITGADEMDVVMETFRRGAYDYIKKPFKWQELIITIQKALQKRKLLNKNNQYHIMLEEMIEEKTLKLQLANVRLEQNMWGTTLALIRALEASDSYTRGHSERVTAVSLIIGKELGYDTTYLKQLRLGAVLHDIGKIGIEKHILNKEGPLNDLEYELMKQHPKIGFEIIKSIDHDEQVFYIVNQHHERVDGKGYPNGLQGDEISILAKIVSIADTYDAMTTDRPYRNALSHKIALKEINRCNKKQFDPLVVDAFNNIEKFLLKQEHLSQSFIEKFPL
jgi:putative nucleotidyltransferase with HDIG domain